VTPDTDATTVMSGRRPARRPRRGPILFVGIASVAALAAGCTSNSATTGGTTAPTSSGGSADHSALVACTTLPQAPWFVAPMGQAPPPGLTDQQKATFVEDQLRRANEAAASAAALDPRWQHLRDLTQQLEVDSSFLQRGSPAPGDVGGLGLALAIECQKVLVK
jgi:hypothetical protein